MKAQFSNVQILPHPLPVSKGMTCPPEGSIIMAHGLEGTAYQRYFSDGLFHGTNGQVVPFDFFLNRVNDVMTPDYIILVGPTAETR